MLGARPAGAGDLLAQRLSCPKDPHARVARGDALRIRVVLDRDLVDVDAAERVRVLGLERAGELADARTHDVRKLLAAVTGGFELGGELVEAAVRDGLAALVVDHGVAQDPIEPSDDRVPDLVVPLQAANERSTYLEKTCNAAAGSASSW